MTTWKSELVYVPKKWGTVPIAKFAQKYIQPNDSTFKEGDNCRDLQN